MLIDARGLKCPLPVLKTEKQLAALASGQQLVVLASDPMAKIDIPHFCRTHGHACTLAPGDNELRFEIVKA